MSNISTLSNWGCGAEAISFKVDTPCLIHGIGIYAGGGIYSDISAGLCKGGYANTNVNVIIYNICYTYR